MSETHEQCGTIQCHACVLKPGHRGPCECRDSVALGTLLMSLTPVEVIEGLREEAAALRAKLAEAEAWRAGHRCDVPPGERLSWHGRVMGEKDAEIAAALALAEKAEAEVARLRGDAGGPWLEGLDRMEERAEAAERERDALKAELVDAHERWRRDVDDAEEDYKTAIDARDEAMRACVRAEAALSAALSRQRRVGGLLKSLEWAGKDEDYASSTCPCCNVPEPGPHRSDCALAAELEGT